MRKYDLPLIIVFVVFAALGVISIINGIVSTSQLGGQIRNIGGSGYSHDQLLEIARIGMAMGIITIIVWLINAIISAVGINETYNYGQENGGDKLFNAVAIYYTLGIIQVVFTLIIAGKTADLAGVKFSLDGGTVANIIFVVSGFACSLVAKYYRKNDPSVDAKRAYYVLLVSCFCWLVCLIIGSASTSGVEKEGITIAKNVFEYLTVAAITLFSIYFVTTYEYIPKKKYTAKVNTTANYQSSTQPQSAQSTQPSTQNIVAQLESLKTLKDKGILTEAEYEEKRKKLVDKL